MPSAAMDEITGELAPGSVDVRLRGRDPGVAVAHATDRQRRPPGPTAPMPVNAWLVRAVLAAVDGGARPHTPHDEGDPDQLPRVKTLFRMEPSAQSFFSSAVISRDLTTTALCLPSVPFGAGPVTVSGTNQRILLGAAAHRI